MLSGGQAETELPDKKINSFISNASRTERSYNSKELKKLYKDVHDAFLTRYVDNPSFNEIFVSGNYNSVTASALYALILEKLSVSYSRNA